MLHAISVNKANPISIAKFGCHKTMSYKTLYNSTFRTKVT